jgi:hypothetical protein
MLHSLMQRQVGAHRVMQPDEMHLVPLLRVWEGLEMPYANSAGVRIYFEVIGSGFPVE